MRVKLHALPPALESALCERLPADGYAVGADEPNALVAGCGAADLGVRVLDMTQDDWQAAIGRARAAFTTVRDFAAALVERDEPGRAVIVIDPSGVRVAEGMGASAVPGAFLTTIAQVAAVELGPRGIAVNVLVAGWMAPAPAGLGDGAPLGRLADPIEIASACEFLLSERASFVTGARLVADGGYVITKTPGGNPVANPPRA